MSALTVEKKQDLLAMEQPFHRFTKVAQSTKRKGLEPNFKAPAISTQRGLAIYEGRDMTLYQSTSHTELSCNQCWPRTYMAEKGINMDVRPGSALALDIQVIINSLFKVGITKTSYFLPIELWKILSFIHNRVMGGTIQGSSLEVRKTLCPCRMPLVQKS